MGVNGDVRGINPLDPAGGSRFSKPQQKVEEDVMGFKVGEVVQTTSPNVALFATYPKAGTAPSGLLAQGVSLMVLEIGEEFLKISTEQGAHGYVSKLMVLPTSMLPIESGMAPEPELPSSLNAAEEDSEVAPQPESVAPPIPEDPTQSDGPAPEPEIPGIQE